MTTREKAMQWWYKIGYENQFYKIIEHSDLIIGDKTRNPDTLTGSEIELIYNAENKNQKKLFNNLSDCCGAVIYTDTDICSNCKEHC